MRSFLNILFFLSTFTVWAQSAAYRVDVSAKNYQELPSGTVEFDLVLECTKGDTAFVGFSDLVLTADWSQFTNPTYSVDNSTSTAQSRSGNTNLMAGFIRKGIQNNSGKLIHTLQPQFVDSQYTFNDNVIALDHGTPYVVAHIEVTGYTGIGSPGFEWVTTGSRNENTSNMYVFNTRSPQFTTEAADLRFTDFPTLNSPRLDITVFLEGPYNVSTGEMSTALNDQGLLPLNNPYSGAPWNYTGGDSVLTIPNADIVDWVLVEIREANNAGNANNTTSLARRAGFLLKDGSIVDLDGASFLEFDNANFDDTKNQYIVVYHRNHLALMCSDGIHEVDTVTVPYWKCDMTTGLATLFGGANGAKLKGGVPMMIAGDAEGSSQIQNSDKVLFWEPQVGSAGYLGADFDLNGQVQNTDKNLIWKENVGKGSQVL